MMLTGGACLAAAGPGSGAISPAELQRYLAGHPQQDQSAPAINTVIGVLTGTGSRNGPRAAALELAERWKIPAAEAEAAIVLVVLPELTRFKALRASVATREREAAARITEAASPSREAWRVALTHLGCDSTALRDRYLSLPWAAADLLHDTAYECDGWLPAVPGVAPVSPLLYRRIAESSSFNEQDRLVALRALRDLLIRQVSWSDARLLFAQRRYWRTLAELGLWKMLLDDARTLEPRVLETVLDGRSGGAAVVEDGFTLEDARYALSIAQSLQPEWLEVLLGSGQRQEARNWLHRWGWDGQGPPPVARGDEDLGTQRDLAIRLVEDRAGDDAYDVFVEHNQLSSAPLDSPEGRRLAIGYLEAHDYPAMVAYLRSLPCEQGLRESVRPVDWAAFPADLQAVRTALQGELAKVGDPGCAPDEIESKNEEGTRARTEIPLPAALRWTGPRPKGPQIPAQAKAGLADFPIVRYSASGTMAAAISLSQDVDPVGEVSGGGYWLHLSSDGGQTWGPPLYLGLQQYEPYEVVADSHLPLIHGRRLQLEVAVNEVDPASITFPPVGLVAKRRARDLYLEMPLDDIERDSDGDGLTDLLEERLLTDPHSRDTDQDGLEDSVDPFPQVSVTAPATVDPEVIRMALSSVLGFEKDAILTGGPIDSARPPALPELIARVVKGGAPRGRSPVLFIEGDKATYQGVSLPRRVVVVSARESREIRRKHGIFYPMQLQLWSNHAHSRAFMRWSAGWVGGSVKLEKKDGRWEATPVDQWIT